MAKVATNGTTILEVGDQVEVIDSFSVRSYGRIRWINRGDRGEVRSVWGPTAHTVEVRFGSETIAVDSRFLALL